MVVGQVLDQYAFFILNGMNEEYLQQLVEDITDSLYVEARLRMKGIVIDDNITPYPDEEF